MRIGFFIGCNVAFNRPDLELAVRFALPRLGVTIEDLEGQSCCPTWGTLPSIDLAGWCALAARNLSLAEKKGVDLVTVCSTCYGSLTRARNVILSNAAVKQKVDALLREIGKEYKGISRARHIVYFLHREVGRERIRGAIQNCLQGLRIAIQPGCLTLWPRRMYQQEGEEDPFHPKALKELCEALGATVPYYSRLLDCCGMGGMRSTDLSKSLILVERKLRSIKEEANPHLIVTGCSSCLLQLDMAQEFLLTRQRIHFKIPVLHYAQLLAVCLGADIEKVTAMARLKADYVFARIFS